MDLQTAQSIGREDLSEYDFLELVAFAHKVGWEGFAYAASDYPPAFERDGYAYSEEPEVLRVLMDRFEPEVSAFWAGDGAEAAYNRHIAEARAHLLD